MDDVLTELADGTPDASGKFAYHAVRQHCADRLNAATHTECAEALGLPRRTFDRLKAAPENRPIKVALHLREQTGLSLDELFPRHPSAEAA
jgi:hypothetical protein